MHDMEQGVKQHLSISTLYRIINEIYLFLKKYIVLSWNDQNLIKVQDHDFLVVLYLINICEGYNFELEVESVPGLWKTCRVCI